MSRGSSGAASAVAPRSRAFTSVQRVVTLAAETGAVAIGTGAGTCNTSTANPMSSYWRSANPVTAGGTGTRYFGTDTRGTLFFNPAGAAVPNPIVGMSVVQ